MSTTTTESTSKPTGFQMPPMSAEHVATQKVGDRLVELMKAGKSMDAIRELYADNVRSVEVMAGPGCDRITEGKKTILEKAEQFWKSMTVHSATCGKAIANGDQFVCEMTMDCTASEGPMANQRMQMSETALYTVRNGQIVESKFFYSCGC
jgi:ketosteroid isomerase-like protein